MRRLCGFAGAALMLIAAAVPAQDEAPKRLKVGDKAPDFKLTGSDGKQYTLKQFAGKQGVVIAWYPKAFTSG